MITETNFGSHVSVGSNSLLDRSSVGSRTYIGPNAVIVCTSIGKFCSIGPDVQLGSGSHPAREFVSTHPIFYLARPNIGWDFVKGNAWSEFDNTIVGNDVWIGSRVIVRDGVSIGDGAIIGAGAVVVKDVAPYTICVGVPARPLRLRFSQEDVDFLLKSKWWDKDEEWLRNNAKSFQNVKRFRDDIAWDGVGAKSA